MQCDVMWMAIDSGFYLLLSLFAIVQTLKRRDESRREDGSGK